MNAETARRLLPLALQDLLNADETLLRRDASERSICARLGLHFQLRVWAEPGGCSWFVDVEFNRQEWRDPKLLKELSVCAHRLTEDGEAYVVPDLVLHQREAAGPNILIVEIKKTTNPEPRDCDRRRVEGFCRHHRYVIGALVDVETREGKDPQAVYAWYTPSGWEDAQTVRL